MRAVSGAPEISVVIAARDAAEVIAVQLDAILAQECLHAFEVVVADNGSTDATAAVVDAIAAGDARVRRANAAGRAGVTYARNAGARAARGEFLVFTDADDLVAPGWLAAVHAALRRTGFAAARLEHERLNPSWAASWRGYEQVEGLVERPYGPPRPYAYGTTIAIRRDLHEAVSGWDETLSASEDMDYCYRVQRDTGAELTFAADAVIHCRHRATLRGTFSQAMTYGAGEIAVQARHTDEWREPLEVMSLPHVVLRNGRRLFKPDWSGGRLDPVRRRSELARWLFGAGADVGRRRGNAY